MQDDYICSNAKVYKCFNPLKCNKIAPSTNEPWAWQEVFNVLPLQVKIPPVTQIECTVYESITKKHSFVRNSTIC